MNEPQRITSDRRTHLERLRGMADVAPDDHDRRIAVTGKIESVFHAHGYRLVETPIIEPTELFLRKAGGDRLAQMYAFHYRDREIALRPEHTASVLRMYTDSMQSEPLPLRLGYTGPVFRYEKPQAGRTRQFTEMGIELLGASGPAADAEVIHLALDGLREVEVEGRLVLGHVGIVLDFLNRLPLRQRARDWLIWSMERMRKGQRVDLESDLAGLVSGDRLADLFDEMSSTFQNVPEDQLEGWVLAVLREVGVQMQGASRTPEEIVAGVLSKMSRHSDVADVRKAFDFVREMVDVQGSPEVVLSEVRRIIQRHGLQDAPIRQIERVLELLAAYGHDVDQIELNLGLGRGLHYYTGMLFEIYDPQNPGAQLCGGGRYDDLAQLLGARQPLPASGFSYGVERVVEATRSADAKHAIDYLVVASHDSSLVAAVKEAERLRAEGFAVELDVRGRSAQANRRHAVRAGILNLAIVDQSGAIQHESLERTSSGDESRLASGMKNDD